MNINEIRDTLAQALPLRVRRFDPDVPPREKVSRLEDYLLESAEHRGALVEARHWLREAEDVMRREIAALDGWEVFLPGRGAKPAGNPSKAHIEEAKERAAPALFDAAREVRKLRGSIDDQIDRLEFEAQFVISRAYTFISGS